MAELTKHITSFFPGPLNVSKHIRRSRLQAFFPFYHAVSDRKLDHLNILYKIPSVSQFKSDLEYLLKFFTPVKMTDYIHGKIKHNPLRPPMILSFDDGLVQCYEEVMPILLKKGVPATFFVNNAFIDNKSMFYRFKVNLLTGLLPKVEGKALTGAAELLHCKTTELRKRLLDVSYVEREIADQVAEVWGFSFSEYLRMKPVYLSSIQIIKLLDAGFEIGSHGIDHPMFSLLKKEVAIAHISESVESLRKIYNLDYKYFAFPFTDSGIEDDTIEQLFAKNIIDAAFGTAGLKDDKWPHYYQRVPMELLNKNAKNTLKAELNRRRIRKLLGNNMTAR